MRARVSLAMAAMVVVFGVAALGEAPRRLNPMIELLAQKKPVFGLYAPSNRRFAGAPGAQAAPAEPPRPATELARMAVEFSDSDFIFDGSMEGDFEKAFPPFADLMAGMSRAGLLLKTPYPHFSHAVQVKTHKIADSVATATRNISRQLNLGVTGLMFVEVESADEVRAGLAAMRFTGKGGTRPDAAGSAPAVWGMSEQDYKEKADLWPLNPNGELVNWTIVESKEGLAHVREIAAVKGIGVLWPGAGTLRQIFSTTQPDGTRKLDEAGWEHAIQTVLAACKEFNVPCGYPATATDIEMRMKQGFSVFVMNWGDQGFKAIDVGKTAAGR